MHCPQMRSQFRVISWQHNKLLTHWREAEQLHIQNSSNSYLLICPILSPPNHLFASILCAWQVFKSLPCQTTTAIKITFCKLKNGHQRYLSSLHNVNNYLPFAMIKYKHRVMRGYLDKNHKV